MKDLIDYLEMDFKRKVDRVKLYAFLYSNKESGDNYFIRLMSMTKFDRLDEDEILLNEDIWEVLE